MYIYIHANCFLYFHYFQILLSFDLELEKVTSEDLYT